MSENLFSPNWYRVKALRPQLQAHISVQRQDYRGLIWYILDDRITNKTHRFNAVAYQFIGQLDGSKTLEQIWNESCDVLGDFALTQDETISLLAQLHQADLLQSELAPNLTELLQRQDDATKSHWRQRFTNPLALKFGLWDPDAFLQRALPFVRWCFHPAFYFSAVVVIVLGVVLASMHWQAISLYTQQQATDPYSIVYLILLYPIVKFLHELAHGFCARNYDCEVHEMGVSFLLFMPVPFVDVSSVNRLRRNRQRMLVGAAGIFTELFLAAVGLFIWLAAEPGVVKDAGFTLLIIGGVSSLLFNGNPLLKYDGYYILADGLGIPNLFQRSRAYLVFLLQRYTLGLRQTNTPASGPGERPWLFSYGILSVAYRIFLIWFIALLLLDINYYVGVALAAWMLLTQVALPVFKGLTFVISSPQLQANRRRALAATGLSTCGLLAILCWLPLPSYTTTQGVVWIPEESQLRAGANGFISDLYVRPNQPVMADDKILSIADIELVSRTDVLRSQLSELNTQYQSQWGVDRVKTANIKAQMKVLAKEITLNLKRIKAMELNSPHSGQLLLTDGDDLPGRFVRKGEVLGYVLTDAQPLVRVVVSQADAGLMNQNTQSVQVRLSSQAATVHTASLERATPQATVELPSPALAREYGGPIRGHAQANGTVQALEKIFTVDLRLPETASTARIGQRVFVRFDHGAEPLMSQWYRGLRRTFLRRFHA
ncbi:HlyD family efflux transporter periplasmic adaptor subunit [Halioxenophilus aromaticivorans]|uniref:Peptidase M50 domain-containing protein n=1 Tax=Halioxenophilus aromaticivorans TaxID=1306992 RepID=A0AAV3U2G5_9ALTE